MNLFCTKHHRQFEELWHGEYLCSKCYEEYFGELEVTEIWREEESSQDDRRLCEEI